VVGLEAGRRRRPDNDRADRQALCHVVVRDAGDRDPNAVR